MTHKDILTPNTPSLGFGAMRIYDESQANEMIDTYMDSGYNYFDTAYAYSGSEELLKKTLVTRHPRDSFMIASKVPPWSLTSPDECEKYLQESLTRAGLDYFDFYLVHSLSDGREQHIEDMKMFDFVLDAKKRGLAKHVGFSFHGSTQYLDRVLTQHPEMEFVQLQLNYVDVLRGPASEWQQVAIKHNKPIIVMEPVRGGTLASLPPAAEKLLKAYAPDRSIASWAISYAANLEGVTSILSGMSTIEQVEDNVETFKNLKPMTAEEMRLIECALVEMDKISDIACTACKYCHEVCPQGIDIANSFSLYNQVKRGDGGHDWNTKILYRTIPEDKQANKCVDCGICIEHCPQNINIPAGLQDVEEALKW